MNKILVYVLSLLFCFGCNDQSKKDLDIIDFQAPENKESEINNCTNTYLEQSENTFFYGNRALKLLTKQQYQNTIYDLTAIEVSSLFEIPGDVLVNGFSDHNAASVTLPYALSYMENAVKITQILKQSNFSQIINCDELSPLDCASKFIDGFAFKAYRRPLTQFEKSTINDFFTLSWVDNIDKSLELSVLSILTSPAFLYRSEQGESVYSGVFDGRRYQFKKMAKKLNATDFDLGIGQSGEFEGGWKLRSKDHKSSTMSKDIDISDEAILFNIKLRAKIISNFTPRVIIGFGDYQYKTTVDWEEFKTLSVYMPKSITEETPDRFYIYLDMHNSTYNASFVEVQSVEVAPAEINPDMPDVDSYILSQYEIATLLSYTYTGSTPDEQLMLAARSNALNNEFLILNQVQRLLKTEKAKQHLENFASQWLGTDNVLNVIKEGETFPALTSQIRKEMAEEVRHLLSYVILESDASIKEFYDSNYVLVGSALAEFYELESGFAGIEKIDAGRDRGGILTTGAFLSTYANEGETSPIKRAVAVREKFLCQHIPIPGMVAQSTTELDDSLLNILNENWEHGRISNRERFELLTQGNGCEVCHSQVINPLGFGMEDYDAIGQYREVDVNNISIDASGALFGMEYLYGDEKVDFYGIKQLSEILANSNHVEQCFIEKFSRYAFNSVPEEIRSKYYFNQCSVETVTAKQMLLNMSGLSSLLYRKEGAL